MSGARSDTEKRSLQPRFLFAQSQRDGRVPNNRGWGSDGAVGCDPRVASTAQRRRCPPHAPKAPRQPPLDEAVRTLSLRFPGQVFLSKKDEPRCPAPQTGQHGARERRNMFHLVPAPKDTRCHSGQLLVRHRQAYYQQGSPWQDWGPSNPVLGRPCERRQNPQQSSQTSLHTQQRH